MSVKKAFAQFCKRNRIKPDGQYAADQKLAFWSGWRAGFRSAQSLRQGYLITVVEKE